MNKNFFLIFQFINALVLLFLILVQSKGTGLGRSFFGSSPLYSTKRGFEKIIFYLTIFFSFTFFVSSIIQLVI